MDRRGSIRLLGMLAVCALALAGCARKELSNEEAYRRFVGIWVNETYPADLIQPEVRIIRADHSIEDLLYTSSTAAEAVWEVDVLKSWSDAKGGACCQFTWHYTEGWRKDERWRRGVGVMRVDREGQVWESNLRWGVDVSSMPERIDPEARNYEDHYFVYYRK